MRGIVSLVVTICLMAVSGVRADDARRCDGESELVAASSALAALGVRRDGGRAVLRPDLRSPLRADLRLAPFTLPDASLALVVPRSVAVRSEHPLHAVLDDVAPARSSRGPPSA